MTGRSKGGRAALDRLANALVEDILSMSDAELLSEVRRGDVNGAAATRAAFNRAIAILGHRPLAGTKTGTRGDRRPLANVRTLDPKTARLRLEELIAWYPETPTALAAAARDGYSVTGRILYCSVWKKGWQKVQNNRQKLVEALAGVRVARQRP